MRAATADAGPSDRVPPFRFSARSRVDIAETDLGAVLYYARYPQHVDRALLAYRRHLGVPLLGPPGHLFVIRSLEVDYRASAHFDDELEVFVRVSELGRTSHAVEARIERVGGGEPGHIADARVMVVGLTEYGGRPSRAPGSMREAIAAFEGMA